MSDTSLDTYYASRFVPLAHRVGRGTLLVAMILCLVPPLYLSLVLGAYPGFGPILNGFLSIAAFVGIMWLIEPVSYFPMLGVCGSYMSFLSGNIGNMRVPVVISCQTAIGAETGSKKAEVAAVIGIAVSVLVNLVFLLALVLVGSALIDVMPAPVALAVKEYTLPALYGAVCVMFFNSAPRKFGLTGLAVAAAIFLSPLPEMFGTTAAGVLALLTSVAVTRGRRARLAGGQPAGTN
ncbi:hypothetical protein [Salipiger sp.]|uniref:hypothetical protein n=1 Tax=Salipiger sp. TaxID=2078585 RepID=UPI003A96AAE6